MSENEFLGMIAELTQRREQSFKMLKDFKKTPEKFTCSIHYLRGGIDTLDTIILSLHTKLRQLQNENI